MKEKKKQEVYMDIRLWLYRSNNDMSNIAANFKMLYSLNIPTFVTETSKNWQEHDKQIDLCIQQRLRQISLGIHSVWSGFTVCLKKVWALNCPKSTQQRLIRQDGCPGWSESLLGAQVNLFVLWCFSSYEPHHEKTCFMPYANKGPDQPAYPCSLIRAFVVHCLGNMVPILAKSKISSLYI